MSRVWPFLSAFALLASLLMACAPTQRTAQMPAPNGKPVFIEFYADW